MKDTLEEPSDEGVESYKLCWKVNMYAKQWFGQEIRVEACEEKVKQMEMRLEACNNHSQRFDSLTAEGKK